MSEAIGLSTDSNTATTVVKTSEQLNTHSEAVVVHNGQMGFNPVPLAVFFVMFVAIIYKLSKLRKAR